MLLALPAPVHPAPPVHTSFADDLATAAYSGPTAYPDTTRDPADEAEAQGYSDGESGEDRHPPADPFLARRYALGYASGEAQRWADYAAWLTEREQEWALERDEWEARQEILWGGCLPRHSGDR